MNPNKKHDEAMFLSSIEYNERYKNAIPSSSIK